MERRKQYNDNGGKCPICGEYTPPGDMQIHHVLPKYNFPELAGDRRNMLAVCTDCHKRIHGNPYLLSYMMLAKAAELGVSLNRLYNTIDYEKDNV